MADERDDRIVDQEQGIRPLAEPDDRPRRQQARQCGGAVHRDRRQTEMQRAPSDMDVALRMTAAEADPDEADAKRRDGQPPRYDLRGEDNAAAEARPVQQ